MTKKKINIIITIMIICIAFFFAFTYAYENYIIQKSDEQYESTLDDEVGNKKEENSSGLTNEESKNN